MPDQASCVDEITNQNFTDYVRSNRYVVIDAYTNGCPACKNYEPIFESVALAFSGSEVHFAKADLEQQQSALKKSVGNDMRTIPLTLFYKDGKLVAQVKGCYDADRLGSAIQLYLDIAKPITPVQKP